ncbi:MAG: zinc ribbon domain-containing protein [Gemmatimonadota bacterium]
MSDGLFTLLRRRMADERLEPGDAVGVAELHKRLLPYHTCRDSLGYATKAEYDVALLRLLADEGRVAVSEPALREAVRAEIRQPEPGLAFLHRFAASEIRVKDAPGGGDAGAGRAEAADAAGAAADVADDCRRCAAPLPHVEGVRFCPACGADQLAPTCGTCGAEIVEGWRYCAFCGKLQDGDSA